MEVPWLQGGAGKAARWLGYIPFEQITDQRNSAPIIRPAKRFDPEPALSVGIDVTIVEDLEPTPWLDNFGARQPYKLVLFGEKSSLDDVLGPLATPYDADLYLPTGEMSDTLLYNMASTGAADGRPVVVLTFSDADPAGWQMPVSIARKLQALKVGFYPELDFEVHRVALTPDQVREYGLPSTPLEATEKRADRWRLEMGTEQTEIDALATLRPDLFRQLVRTALSQFYDHTLSTRVVDAEEEWRYLAQSYIDEQLSVEQLGQLRLSFNRGPWHNCSHDDRLAPKREGPLLRGHRPCRAPTRACSRHAQRPPGGSHHQPVRSREPRGDPRHPREHRQRQGIAGCRGGNRNRRRRTGCRRCPRAPDPQGAMTEPYELVVARPAARAISEELPEAVAVAVIALITGDLLKNPSRVGRELRNELAGVHSARRGTYRVLYRINDEQREVTILRVEHRSAAYRPS
jgi:mRNA-degrading endonuclease RelE of RelBE toxin-antitoxin system